MSLLKIGTDDQVADALTKVPVLPRPAFVSHRGQYPLAVSSIGQSRGLSYPHSGCAGVMEIRCTAM
eukprot:1841486-Rhodomonas_salina.1